MLATHPAVNHDRRTMRVACTILIAGLLCTSAGTARAAAQGPSVSDAARRDAGRRIVISLRDRALLWMDGRDTLRVAPIATGKGTLLVAEGRTWSFDTPPGIRKVVAKARNPVWVPPEWHYVELSRKKALKLAHLVRGRAAPLPDGSRLVIRRERIVHLRTDGSEALLPADEEIVFGDTLFVPPFGTANRRIPGELGAFKLDMGDGYLIHGTPDTASIGTAASHGCVRVGDEDLAYLFEHVPVGTPIYIF